MTDIGISLPPLVLVDGHNLLWRAAYGFPARVQSRDGVDRTTAFGFISLLRAATRNVTSDAEWLVIFDGQFGAAERKTTLATYKDGRAERGQNPISHLVDVKRCLDVADVPWMEDPSLESDDVIASIVKTCSTRSVVIMSSDRDYYQLLDERVTILDTSRREGERVITAGFVLARYSVDPALWCDYRALTGDSSDSIPGVPGFGPVRAARILAGMTRLEDLQDGPRLADRHGKALAGMWETVLKNRNLMRLNANIPIMLPEPRRIADIPIASVILNRVGLL